MTRVSIATGRAAADTIDLVLLEHAQQLRLQRRLHLAHLVEQQRAAVRQLELAELARRRAGERAALVAEELALEQLARQRRAVDRDEGLRSAADPTSWT